MAGNSREIKRRIKSVRNIGQITKAMELVSAAKMRRAQQAALASRPYAVLSSDLLNNLAAKANLSKHPLINRVMNEDGRKASDKFLAILITSDRGLAGAFNSNVVSKALSLLSKEGSEKFDFITVGKKGSDAIRRMQGNIVAAFPTKDKLTKSDIGPVTQIAIEDYLKYKYDKVFLIYTDFVSTLTQKPNIIQLLPFEPKVEGKATEDLLFEPNVDEVLESLIVKTVEFTVFQAMVEAAASEHSARMVAMRNANEATGELIDDLSLSYNQARQAGITRELSEISAAKLAMEG